jgi:hypothetical protein
MRELCKSKEDPVQTFCKMNQTEFNRVHLWETQMMSWQQGDLATMVETEKLWVEDSWIIKKVTNWTKKDSFFT